MIYIPVFALLLLFDSFLYPLRSALIVMITKHRLVFPEKSCARILMTWMYDDISRPNTVVKPFKLEALMMVLINQIALLMTWGLIFPPLAVMACFAVWVRAHHMEIAIGHRLHVAQQYRPSEVLEIQRECRKIVPIMKQSRIPIAGICSFVCSLVVFDTLSNELGFRKSIWVVVFLSLCPLLVFYAYQRYAMSTIGPKQQQEEELNKFELTKVSNPLRSRREMSTDF